MRSERPRALIVEDEPSWQEILGEILADAGLAIDRASSLDEATASLRAAPHRLAVVDLSLGGADHRNQDGLAVLDAVRQLDPGCVPILLTGYATVELAVSALTEHGAFTCLRKETFRRRHFREVVDRALAHAPLAPAPADEAGPGASEAVG
ncbi:MAG: response regulator, partial [Anaerolineae bacterium]|nr:response regulator [Anaerolineae bacterium]